MLQKKITDLIIGAIRSEFKRKDDAIEYAKIGIQKEKDRINLIISKCKKFETENFKLNPYDFVGLDSQMHNLDHWKNYSCRNAFNPILPVYGKEEDLGFFYGELDYVTIQIDMFVKLTGLSKRTLSKHLKDLVEVGVIIRNRVNGGYQYKLPQEK